MCGSNPQMRVIYPSEMFPEVLGPPLRVSRLILLMSKLDYTSVDIELVMTNHKYCNGKAVQYDD